MSFEEKYFREELDYLRQLGKLLAKEKPHLAPFLAEKEADPDVERLLEGFAFLSGNMRSRIEDEFPELTHSLLNMLWPNYLRPTPSMTIMEYVPDPKTVTTAFKVSEGAQVMSPSGEVTGKKLDNSSGDPLPSCKFNLGRDIWLLPLSLESVSSNNSHKHGMIDINFLTGKQQNLSALDFGKIRLWLGNDDNYTRYQIYLWFCEYMTDVELVVGEKIIHLPDFRLYPVGFEKQDALLPYPKNVYSGYRVLQEYLCFLDSFFFFDITGVQSLPEDLVAEQFTLRLHFSRPLPADLKLRKDSLRLYCTPAVNLFSESAETIVLDDASTQYFLEAHHQTAECYDIFSVDSVQSGLRNIKRNGKSAETITHTYVSFESFQHQVEYAQQREALYYRVKTQSSLTNPGFEHYISFVHGDGTYQKQQYIEDNEEIVSIMLTCTNRDLPAQLKIGDINLASGKDPAITSFRNVTRPSLPLYPILDGSLHWSLLSNMSLNYLSLLDLEALKQVLRTYDLPGIHHPQAARLSQQKLDAMEQIETHPVDRLFKGVPVRGLASTISIRQTPFVCEGDLYLLGTVLSHFFSLYASVNSFHILKVVNIDNQECYEWPERIGQHALI
ncbi:type VI secretion system baseplate subunit TssF [Rahnella sp. PD12R]|uniref:type VI secretion system baseplate subunit TssF n=1 Tax=Rahnella sp. PD12R TaxID=2855688 RepID=UPI001C45668C|nr:type VI secretion system baseplate subunit TssF [Rahnella sp. PD12R]MBV6818408.1 type VI secretion system baseplate subunit TssF [Rahnella sp. PD12R]